MAKWKIFGKGWTYSDQDGEPFNAPGLGVLLIAQEHPTVGVEIICKEEFYWWLDRWLGGNERGVWCYQAKYLGPQKVIHGEVVSNDEFNAAILQALKDPYFPKPKDGRLPGEKH